MTSEEAPPVIKGSLDANEDIGVVEVSSAIDDNFDIGESIVESMEVHSEFSEFLENKESVKEVVVGGGEACGVGEDKLNRVISALKDEGGEFDGRLDEIILNLSKELVDNGVVEDGRGKKVLVAVAEGRRTTGVEDATAYTLEVVPYPDTTPNRGRINWRSLLLSRIAEACFEDERSITDIAKTNNLNAGVQIQDLKETIRLMPNKVEAFQTSMVATFEEHEQQENQDNLNEFSGEKDDAKPPIFIDIVGNNGDNDSRTSGSETPAKEVVDNGIESEVVVGLPDEFQGDMVDALSLVEHKSLGNWKELDSESKDRKVERDAKREGEPTILAIFDSDQEQMPGFNSIVRAFASLGHDLGSETPAKEVVDNGIESEVVVGLPDEFQGDMVDALSLVEHKSLGNWNELDSESKDRKVERDAKREGEPTILAIFNSDQGITIWDPRIKSAFQDDTLRVRWFRRSEECYALNLG
nr:hypothetical protein [Tanacetum cinerariifolium]